MSIHSSTHMPIPCYDLLDISARSVYENQIICDAKTLDLITHLLL